MPHGGKSPLHTVPYHPCPGAAKISMSSQIYTVSRDRPLAACYHDYHFKLVQTRVYDAYNIESGPS